jgi:ABC-2 type transport system permease protein
MIAIFKKELWNYFGNWTAWVIIGAFSFISSLFLFFFENNYNIFDIGMASMQSYFTLVPWILMFIIPALSMKTIAEEQQSGTLYWLFSQPIKIKDIILGKFLSVWFIGFLCLIPSLVYFYTLYVLGIPEGNIDLGATLGSYFGLILLIGGMTAVGLLASSLSSNQIMAYLLGVFKIGQHRRLHSHCHKGISGQFIFDGIDEFEIYFGINSSKFFQHKFGFSLQLLEAGRKISFQIHFHHQGFFHRFQYFLGSIRKGISFFLG